MESAYMPIDGRMDKENVYMYTWSIPHLKRRIMPFTGKLIEL
jgi:hypothetical protein